MATTMLTTGPVHAITQNVVYALPGRTVRVFAAAAVEVSLDGSTFTALTGSNTVSGALTAAPFLRCATGNTTVIIKID